MNMESLRRLQEELGKAVESLNKDMVGIQERIDWVEGISNDIAYEIKEHDIQESKKHAHILLPNGSTVNHDGRKVFDIVLQTPENTHDNLRILTNGATIVKTNNTWYDSKNKEITYCAVVRDGTTLGMVLL